MVYELALSEITASARLASCLTRNEVVLYSSKTCPHCQAQKNKFGSAMEYINNIEYSGNSTIFSEEGIKVVPTWIFRRQDKRIIGERSLNELANFAGCSYRK